MSIGVININGVSILTGTILMPLVGVWTADVVIDQPDGTGFEAGTKVSITSENGFELKGVVSPYRTGDFLDAVHVRVLGGAGGMAKICTPRSFVQPGAFVKDVLNGLASDSGETLASSIDSSFFNTNLTAWSVMNVSVSQALTTLIDMVLPGLNWRILPDGTLWIGHEKWDTSDIEYISLTQDPSEKTVTLGVDSPEIVPGINLNGIGNINRVEHQILQDTIRSHVWLDIPGTQRGVKDAIIPIVKQAMGGVDYLAFYECTVQSQSADLSTVDIKPVAPADQRLAGLSRVPVMAGSGVKVQFAQGAKVLLGWQSGNPSMPYVSLGLGADSVQRIQLGGNTDVARKDDNLSASAAFKTWAAAVDAGIATNTPPPTPFATAAGLPGGMGTINQGSSIVGAG